MREREIQGISARITEDAQYDGSIQIRGKELDGDGGKPTKERLELQVGRRCQLTEDNTPDLRINEIGSGGGSLSFFLKKLWRVLSQEPVDDGEAEGAGRAEVDCLGSIEILCAPTRLGPTVTPLIKGEENETERREESKRIQPRAIRAEF